MEEHGVLLKEKSRLLYRLGNPKRIGLTPNSSFNRYNHMSVNSELTGVSRALHEQ
jgi:hypothetical protein